MLTDTLRASQIKESRIEVFGLGYVGLPLSVRLAANGWVVTGIDINQDRISRLEKNHLYKSEVHLKDDFDNARKSGLLTFSTVPKVESKPKIGIICVPTPVPTSGINSDTYVKDAVEKFLDSSKDDDVIIIESSIEVGTTDEIKKIIENKGLKIGQNYGLSFCPERIDPNNKKWLLENIPRIIYCSDDVTFDISKIIYRDVNNSNMLRVSSVKVAEVAKSFENAFRLVNISLVNELAILCDNLNINVDEVISAASTKSFGFMRFNSGAGAGGHCIPKDPIFLLESSKKFGTEFKTIQKALEINLHVPKYIVSKITSILDQKGLEKSVLVVGLAYKENIEDMRDSPGFKLVNEFHMDDYMIGVHDPFFKTELLQKYLQENKQELFPAEILPKLESENIKKYNCLCIVQHHDLVKSQIESIYRKSQIPIIYDCQNKIVHDINSQSLLYGLGKKQ